MKKILSLLIVAIFVLAVFACKGAAPNDTAPGITGSAAVGYVPYESIPSESTFKSTYGSFGTHFNNWLNSHGYSGKFGQGGFGGFRSNYAPDGSKRVIVFIHGNGSKANGSTGDPKGWYNTYKYLRDRGWNNSELYAVNYGFTSLYQVTQNDHRTDHINKVKDFINAVYAYTGKKVTVVAHSLGCTLSRKAMKDGNLYSKVETFISIAGAHKGLLTCGSLYYGWWYVCLAAAPTCSAATGLCLPPAGHYLQTSTSYFLGKLNSSSYGDSEMAGKTTRTYVIYSLVDEICSGRTTYTSLLNGMYKSKQYSYAPYGHFNCKDLTQSVQYSMINRTF